MVIVHCHVNFSGVSTLDSDSSGRQLFGALLSKGPNEAEGGTVGMGVGNTDFI